ncbi:MAG: hypothetical protein QOG53_782 [Frankiales bacterium]|nr:hypothetical protein [Frankiales bacterium]
MTAPHNGSASPNDLDVDDLAAPANDSVADLVVRVAGAAGDERRRLLVRLGRALARSGRIGGKWLVDTTLDLAPRVPVRDLATLQAHHPGLGREDLADALVAAAAKSTAGIGAAGGALAAVEYAAPPTLLGAPLQVVAETLAVVAVELKLVAELHAVYGVAVSGTPRQRATAYALAWAQRRGAEGLGISSLGRAARKQLQNRLLRRIGRSSFTVAPFLAGAAAGAILNSRETNRVGNRLREDLRRHNGLIKRH